MAGSRVMRSFRRYVGPASRLPGVDRRSAGAGAAKTILGRLVGWVEPDSFAIRLGRLRLFAAPFIDQRLVGPCLGVLLVELDGHVEVGEGVIFLVERQIGKAA